MVITNMKIRARGGDLVFEIVNHVLLILAAIVVIYPLYLIIIASISDPYAVMRGEVLLYPKDISFIGYQKLLQNPEIWRAYLNTIIYTVVGTVLNVLITMMAGYALSRKFAGRRFMNFYFVFTMFFSGGLIPTFLLVRSYGLYNNPLIMIVMGALGVWNLMIARSFIASTLPEELYEAAVVDGCSHFRYFFFFVLPLSQALMAILGVYYAVGHWNDFMTAIIYLSKYSYMPLQVIVRNMVAALQMTEEMTNMLDEITDYAEVARIAESVKYCVILVSTAPIIVLYLSLQKYFVKGAMIGSLKG